MRLVMYRNFGGEYLYRRGRKFNTKGEAKKHANDLRKKGTLARIVKSTDPVSYTVWMRERLSR